MTFLDDRGEPDEATVGSWAHVPKQHTRPGKRLQKTMERSTIFNR